MTREKISTCSLDGNTVVQARNVVVRRFNYVNICDSLLLSAKAGGGVLSLIETNRIIQLDTDFQSGDRYSNYGKSLGRESNKERIHLRTALGRNVPSLQWLNN